MASEPYSQLDQVAAFVGLLQELSPQPHTFNPWRDYDRLHDSFEGAPKVRGTQLTAYLSRRLGKAKLVLVAEAPGYQGAKHSGIAMTSERILLGYASGVPGHFALGELGRQTSRIEIHPKGRAEPTATLVWKQMMALGYAPDDFVLWNAYPCHPHEPGNPLTNRAPTRQDMAATSHVLPAMLQLFPSARVVAVGNIARNVLAGMGVSAPAVRHPANGGATKFRDQLAELSS